MRNKMEGHFTRWHEDFAYPLIYNGFLKSAYANVKTLPSPDEVLAWRQKREKLIARRSAMEHEQGEIEAADAEEWDEIDALSRKWAPTPSESPWGTPIPKKYFTAATGKTWKPWTKQDLVPHEQDDLIQDGGPKDISKICSADARACIAVCRPVGQFSEKRQIGRDQTMTTHMHQSGALPLQPLYPAQDAARGMCSSLVVKESFRKEFFELKEGEPEALQTVLPWLNDNNPWLATYSLGLLLQCQQKGSL